MIIGQEDTEKMYDAVSMIVFKKEAPNQIDRDLERLLMVLENAVHHGHKGTAIPENLVETFKTCYIQSLFSGLSIL